VRVCVCVCKKLNAVFSKLNYETGDNNGL